MCGALSPADHPRHPQRRDLFDRKASRRQNLFTMLAKQRRTAANSSRGRAK